MKQRYGLSEGVILAIAVGCLGPGCAAPQAGGVLPFGDWSGHGLFVYENFKPAKDDADSSDPRSIHREYSTTLSIQPAELDGRDVIKMTIRSKRGELPDLMDETHLIVAMVEARRVSDSTVLYRSVAQQLNPEPGERLEFDDAAPPAGASCTTLDGVTTFIIEYMENFVDVFRFKGNRVEKRGTYFNKKEGFVHWTETLRK